MPSATSNERQALLRALKSQREHIFEALQGLNIDDLRRQVLPSRWTCLGLVNHLSLDVEHLWFQAVIAGDQTAVQDVLASSDNTWDVGVEVGAASSVPMRSSPLNPSMRHLRGGQRTSSAPGGWKAFERSCSTSLRRPPPTPVILTRRRELIDGKQHLVLTE